MIQIEVAYICDCCGRKRTFPMPENLIERRGKEGSAVYDVAIWPENTESGDGLRQQLKGWSDISTYGLCCDQCMEAFNSVYERIHAPIKAKEMRHE